jgi:excisionase family DNA binding protein
MPTHGENKPSAETVNSAILPKQQAAELLQFTVRYVERMISAGRLRACKPSGKFVRIFRKDLDAFLDKSASIGGRQEA